MECKTEDRAVQSLLSDQRDKTDSPVVRAIQDVLAAIHGHDLNYGAKVRVLTKALMIVNEEHRLNT